MGALVASIENRIELLPVNVPIITISDLSIIFQHNLTLKTQSAGAKATTESPAKPTPKWLKRYIHTYIHTYIHKHIHTYINTYEPAAKES